MDDQNKYQKQDTKYNKYLKENNNDIINEINKDVLKNKSYAELFSDDNEIPDDYSMPNIDMFNKKPEDDENDKSGFIGFGTQNYIYREHQRKGNIADISTYFRGRSNQGNEASLKLPVQLVLKPLMPGKIDVDTNIMFYEMGFRVGHAYCTAQDAIRDLNRQLGDVCDRNELRAEKPKSDDIFDQKNGGYSVIYNGAGQPVFRICFDRQLEKTKSMSNYDKLKQLQDQCEEEEVEETLQYYN